MTDKSEKRSYSLISGSFVADDARQVLLTLIDHKISFHQRTDWGRRERLGEVEPTSAKRIAELRQTKEDVAKMIEDAAALGRNIRINCDIEIVLEPS